MIELLSKDQFIDAIPDDETKVKIRQSRPDSLRRALETALELESYQLASLRRGRPVRAARTNDGELREQTSAVAEQKPEWVDDLIRCIRQCTNDTRTREPGGKQRSRPVQTRRPRNCWKCGKPGYLQQNCPNRDAEHQGNGNQPGL